jgi:tRNA G46 methylase TrmB
MSDDRQCAPATLRNRDFILDVLRDVLPTTGVILEIASGSGKHVVHCARNLPSLVFQPSDLNPDALLSIATWVKAAAVKNMCAHLIALDATIRVGRSLQRTGLSASTWSTSHLERRLWD